MKGKLINHADEYTEQDIKLIKKWTGVAAKQGLLVERMGWLEDMIHQSHMYSLKQNDRINLFFLLRHLFTFNQAKVGVSQNGIWRHPDDIYGPMTNKACVNASLKLNLSVTFIAIYKHNQVGNTIFCDDTGFKQIGFDQVNPKVFSNKTFQPNPNTMFLKYYTPFDKEFLKENDIILLDK
jgi:hypothetical protein